MRAVLHRLTWGLAAVLTAGAAAAQEGLETVGKPVPGGTGFQPMVTEVGRDILFLNNFLLYLITAISLFVMVLLLIVIFHYNAKSNPKPARFTHHSALEIGWTLGPVVILIVIGALSLPILFKQLEIPDPDITIKTTGYQWYWGYEYPDEGLVFDAFMLERDELA
ncbi:MAG: cytochrome c oxidase subunit II transmembrane domain-containing protein, partial [Pseudomonadota bacterium]